jgi:Ser/Thr protein kinase RdoA (MazF antagonist)
LKQEIRTLLTPQGVRQMATHWPEAGDTELIDDVTNVVFAFQCQGRPRILRLTHCSQQSQQDIEAELDWVRFLAQNDVPVARPIASSSGSFTEILPVGDSCFVAAVFERAEGEMVDPAGAEHWNPSLIRSLGQLMGRMHALTKHYDPGHLIKRRWQWEESDDVVNASHHVPRSEVQLLRDLATAVECLSGLPRDVDSYGLVHCDVNFTNYLVKDGRITLFDCADCCYSYFIADIAAAMMFYQPAYFQPDWKPRAEAMFQTFMRGYNEENQLQAFWYEHLGGFLKLQNMLTLVFCHAEDVASGPYGWFFDLVRDVYRAGHRPYEQDFRALYESLPR